MSDPPIAEMCDEVRNEAIACQPEAAQPDRPDATQPVKSEAPQPVESEATQPVKSEATQPVKPEGISKNEWKRQLKQKKFEESKAARRHKEKEKRKERRRRQREEDGGAMPQVKRTKMSDSCASNIRVAIEYQYEPMMNDKDVRKLMKQSQRCYSANRRSGSPLQLYFTSFDGRIKEMMEKANQCVDKWDVHVRKHSFLEEFSKMDIVFLAAESENTLTDLDPSKVYIIGGLVDHNHYKGYCYQQALEKGISHARLPISDYLQLNSRAVLTVNHAYVQNHDWEQAFRGVIPERKVLTKEVASEDDDPEYSHTPTPDSNDARTH